MNPNQDPYRQNPTPEPTRPTGIYSADPTDHVQHHTVGRTMKMVRRTGLGLLILGIIAATGYGANLMGKAIQEGNEQLAIIQAIDEAKIYRGDGADILKIVAPEVEQTCPEGYDKSGEGDNVSCLKEETSVVSAKNYSCPSGFASSGEGSGLQCSKVVGGSPETVAATQISSCPDGYQSNGGKCSKTEQVPQKTIVYSCPEGTQKSGTEKTTQCSITTTETAGASTSCPGGFAVSGGSCLRNVAAANNPTYSCPAGYTVTGTKCSKIVNKVATSSIGCASATATLLGPTGPCGIKKYGANVIFSCPSGQFKSGQWCAVKGIMKAGSSCPAGTPMGTSAFCNVVFDATPVAHFSCPGGGSLAGDRCKSTSALIYSCPAGFALAGTGCSKSNITYKNVIVSEGCASDFTKAGDKCEKVTTVGAQSSYKCADSSYTLAGTSCSRVVGGQKTTAQPAVSYACGEGYTTSGSGETMQCTKKVTKTEAAQVGYKCAEGLLKRQTGATVDCVEIAKD